MVIASPPSMIAQRHKFLLSAIFIKSLADSFTVNVSIYHLVPFHDQEEILIRIEIALIINKMVLRTFFGGVDTGKKLTYGT